MPTVATFTTTGIRAALIEKANNASFYGIMKSSGDTSNTEPGLAAACDAVRDYLASSGIAWNSYNIIRAKTIDTTGTKTPYMAEITFSYD